MIKKIGDCRNNFLSIVYGKLSELKSCEKLVKQHLPEKLAQHCQVSEANNGIITLITTNAGILSQLHYEKPELLRKLRTEEKMYALKTIKLKLEAPHLRILKTAHLSPKISQKRVEKKPSPKQSLKKALEKLEKTLQDKGKQLK